MTAVPEARPPSQLGSATPALCAAESGLHRSSSEPFRSFPQEFVQDVSLEPGSCNLSPMRKASHPRFGIGVLATLPRCHSHTPPRLALRFLRQQRAGLGAGFRRQLSQALQGFSFAGRVLRPGLCPEDPRASIGPSASCNVGMHLYVETRAWSFTWNAGKVANYFTRPSRQALFAPSEARSARPRCHTTSFAAQGIASQQLVILAQVRSSATNPFLESQVVPKS